MISTKTEYQKRLREVESYLNTIELLDEGSCSIECVNINGEKYIKRVDPELAKILKANCFLILYNLIEATIRNSIVAILSSIHKDKLSYKKLTSNLRNIWIGQEVKKIADNSKLKAKIGEISESILNGNLLTFKSECIDISGNIDARKIRDIARLFGYVESQNGECLYTIKERRNKLSHGEYTFSDVGKEYTSKELIKFKDETVAYINEVLNNVDSYIRDKKYKA